ncbi:hypothetical protein TcasGA2_TC000659 [Tribolium castaneum]|uniref:Uncharacterized protein n=1 Tax=Tribolium castaneum TaxID=7070 RepID=D6W907_TRICA|nr:hypothetical protein TcasGA2_TC000659 [Tribolium castaneum]
MLFIHAISRMAEPAPASEFVIASVISDAAIKCTSCARPEPRHRENLPSNCVGVDSLDSSAATRTIRTPPVLDQRGRVPIQEGRSLTVKMLMCNKNNAVKPRLKDQSRVTITDRLLIILIWVSTPVAPDKIALSKQVFEMKGGFHSGSKFAENTKTWRAHLEIFILRSSRRKQDYLLNFKEISTTHRD